MEKRLKKAIDSRGFRYNFVANQVGISYSHLISLLNGRFDMPMYILVEILYVCKIPFEEVHDDYPQWKGRYLTRVDIEEP